MEMPWTHAGSRRKTSVVVQDGGLLLHRMILVGTGEGQFQWTGEDHNGAGRLGSPAEGRAARSTGGPVTAIRRLTRQQLCCVWKFDGRPHQRLSAFDWRRGLATLGPAP